MAERGGEPLRPLHREVLEQVDHLIALAEGPGSALNGADRERTPVSRWSPLEHAEHLALADEASLHQLEAALDRDDGPKGTLVGRLVLLLGWIPRGVGKAPEQTRAEGVDRYEVAERLRAVRERIEALGGRLDEVAAARGRASHPVFRGLTAAQWLKFLSVHHRHHLKIIEDIRRAAGDHR